MFYAGYDVAYNFISTGDDGVSSKHFKIGDATSDDGINFTKHGFIVQSSAPYLDPNLDFNQYVVGEPAPSAPSILPQKARYSPGQRSLFGVSPQFQRAKLHCNTFQEVAQSLVINSPILTTDQFLILLWSLKPL